MPRLYQTLSMMVQNNDGSKGILAQIAFDK
jgi:hypothetical protein